MNTHLIPSASLAPVISSESKNNGAMFTLRSKKTGKDYTYKISRSEFNGNWYTHIKVETQYLKFKRLGTYFKGNIYNKKHKVDNPSAVAISFVLDKVEKNQFEFLDNSLEVYHTGHCLKCGRILTDTDSIKRGLGSYCANH
jgi:hypothetical protein